MRRAAVVKVQIARRDLGLDEPTYRAMLERLTGETSSARCTDGQLGRVLDEMKGKGWKPSSPAARSGGPASSTRRAADSPMAKKARAMWISLHQLGEVRNASEQALEGMGRRQLGVDKLQWADQSQAHRLIEALKAMATRAGWPQDGDDVRLLREGLFQAQERKLAGFDPERMSEADQAPFLSNPELTDRIEENAGHIHAYLKRSS